MGLSVSSGPSELSKTYIELGNAVKFQTVSPVIISGKAWSPYMRRPALYPFPHPPRHDPSAHIQTMPGDAWSQPWSNNPTAPRISKFIYTWEKTTLDGSFVGSILYASGKRSDGYEVYVDLCRTGSLVDKLPICSTT